MEIKIYICHMEIGQMVKWTMDTVGDIQCIGTFIQELNATTSEVICHYMNDKKHIFKLQVETIKLEQI